MAIKSGQDSSVAPEDVEELLDTVDKTLDRLKTLYEQYFLGIQKQAPAYIHSDVERKLRELMQMQIRNTGLRYRFTSIQAKFASYNSYWRRTLRQIENGTYVRNLHKIGRAAARSGADIPEEILAAMPKRMREQVLKDREAALAAARRHHQLDEPELLSLADDEPAFVKEGTELRRQVRGAHVVQEDADFDLDAFFKEVEAGDADDKTPEDQPPAAPPPRPAVAAAPQRATGPVPAVPGARATGPVPAVPPIPAGPRARQTGPVPVAPSQAVRPNPIAPGSAAARGDVGVESMAGPFPRQPTGPVPRQPMDPSASGGIPRPPSPGATGPVPRQPTGPVPRQPTGPVPRQPTGPVPRQAMDSSASGGIPRAPSPGATGPVPRQPSPGATGPVPRQPSPGATGPVPRQPMGPGASGPIARPGAPRPAPPVSAQSQPMRPTPMPRPEPAGAKAPPGMTDADVNALYAKYVKAKESVGEKVGPGGYGKLLNTINQQAPKIMEQYKAKAVDFSVVVKDNQVIIRAKPKP